ncbi:MAG: sugar phosphate isomerase/epimerase family protein [Planctomycetota bacterium]
MAGLKIGVLVESLRLGVRAGIEKAAELGFDGVQLYVTGGEMAPENLSKSGRRDFLRFVRERDLTLSALCVELGGYTSPEGLDEKIVRTQAMLDLGLDLGVTVHTSHIGRIPADPADPTRQALAETLRTLGDYAAERGRCLACETGPEDTPLMHDFLASVGSEGIRVNFDPANLVMNGFEPCRGVYELADFIVHTHAKDGVRREDGSKEEVPLGHGQVPWECYVETLRDVGYDGFHTIEREAGDSPVADVVAAKRFLERF